MALIAQPQSSTNQLALSPVSPARPSHSGDKVRFVLLVILPGRLLSATVCRSKSSFRDDNNLHVNVSVLREAMVWQEGIIGKCASGCYISNHYEECMKSMAA